jgi:hypothetical protein
MKRFACLTIALSCYSYLFAQNTEALVKAERDFEKSCLEAGIRDGFLAHVDSNGIVFTDKGPVDAKKFWTALPVFEGVFTWSPSYAEMSIGAEWGYTTGNYEHRPRVLKDTVEDSGQYTTVWHKTENGQWKYLIDIGNRHPHRPLDNTAKTIDQKKYGAGNNSREDFLLDQENTFIQLFEKSINEAYRASASNRYILNITSRLPVLSSDSSIAILSKVPSLHYMPVGLKISPANDLAAVYGTFSQSGKEGNYLRIWRHEKNGWKIALEVIRI